MFSKSKCKKIIAATSPVQQNLRAHFSHTDAYTKAHRYDERSLTTGFNYEEEMIDKEEYVNIPLISYSMNFNSDQHDRNIGG